MLARCVLIAMLALWFVPTGPIAGQEREELPQLADIRPDSLASAEEVAATLPRYRIDATVSVGDWAEPATIHGSVAIEWTNTTEGPADSVPLRLYPAAPAYGEGDLLVEDLTVDGQALSATPSGDGTVLVVPLPEPLDPGRSISLGARFTTTVPVDSAAAFGIFATKPASKSLALGHWYPMLAGRDDRGWSLEPFSRNGDPIFSSSALYDVTIRTPGEVDVAATGIEVSVRDDGATIERRIVAGPVRDMVLALDDDWETATTDVGGIRVTAWAAEADGDENAAVLAAATAALRSFQDRFGAYPYRELDVVQMDLSGAAGMEYPGLVLIGTGIYDRILGPNGRYAETVVAHEIAHQWWYGLVGSNQHRHAFIDEGLAEFAGVALYVEDRYGRDAAERAWSEDVRRWWRDGRGRLGSLGIDAPTDAFPDRAAYAAAVYPGAAIGFATIRAYVGDEAFFAALRAVVEDHRFGVAEPAEVRDAFSRACGCDVRPLWRALFSSPVNDPALAP